jgi:hypothetical protein
MREDIYFTRGGGHPGEQKSKFSAIYSYRDQGSGKLFIPESKLRGEPDGKHCAEPINNSSRIFKVKSGKKYIARSSFS